MKLKYVSLEDMNKKCIIKTDGKYMRSSHLCSLHENVNLEKKEKKMISKLVAYITHV